MRQSVEKSCSPLLTPEVISTLGMSCAVYRVGSMPCSAPRVAIPSQLC